MMYRLFTAIFTFLLMTSPALHARQNPYVLGPQDRLRIVVFGEPDLSGEFSLDDIGQISMPLIGLVALGGLARQDAEVLIASRFSQGYLQNPSVSIDIIAYRPFYILGEVNNPGAYEFATGLSVLKAVAIAGGFTYRANESRFDLVREQGDTVTELTASPITLIQPGDILRIRERYF
ncbi:MAG: polysaccharide biosynthesis/export family protein [Pseudomonadota bacterium]